jgi:hypothetical protein
MATNIKDVIVDEKLVAWEIAIIIHYAWVMLRLV